jgi:pyruvate/2-oxoglutarate dehydrogenase complex dihydrolipoamide acyltransferase (E2) component
MALLCSGESVEEDEASVWMCYVTLTIDHRVLDGYQANAFLARWVEEIEGWR